MMRQLVQAPFQVLGIFTVHGDGDSTFLSAAGEQKLLGSVVLGSSWKSMLVSIQSID